jgi:hypothetical protein
MTAHRVDTPEAALAELVEEQRRIPAIVPIAMRAARDDNAAAITKQMPCNGRAAGVDDVNDEESD